MIQERSQINEAPMKFETEEQAWTWMYEQVDDPCVDNDRFAYYDDDAALAKYEEAYEGGCCGVFDADVEINGRLAMIGCNFGH